MPSVYLEFSLKFQSNYQITPQIQTGKLFSWHMFADQYSLEAIIGSERTFMMRP